MALIVVADDEVLLAEMLGSILEDSGHEVLIASHGRRALELIRERRPSLLITDFMMPVMNGLELAQTIRADREIADLPIVMVTGAQGNIARQHQEIFNEIVDKPYDMAQLLEIVVRFIPST